MYDLIIIGAGPAGLSAGLYAGRFRLKTIIMEKAGPGGQILLTPTIENYPGLPGAVPTEQLIASMQKQVEELGVELRTEEVSGLNCGSEFKIIASEGEYLCRAVIVASGAHPRRLGIKGEDRLTGKGVSYCGTCDGPLFKDKEIALIGAGDRAIEEALFLSGYAQKVNIIHRRQALRASKILEEKARGNPKINFILDSVAEEVLGKDRVSALKIKNVKTGAPGEVACAGVFIFVGIEPNTGFLKNALNMDEPGFIISDEKMQTSRAGVFACGDCRRKELYQAITAAGEGATAAFSAHKYLMEK